MLPRYLGGGILVGLLVLIQTLAEWLLRTFDPPIMGKRINEASDEYLDNRGSPLDEGKRRILGTDDEKA